MDQLDFKFTSLPAPIDFSLGFPRLLQIGTGVGGGGGGGAEGLAHPPVSILLGHPDLIGLLCMTFLTKL